MPEERLQALNIHRAIVLAPPYAAWAAAHVPTGTWMLQYPHPDPFFRDDIIFGLPHADPAALHKRFPDRAIYQLGYARREPALVVTPLP